MKNKIQLGMSSPREERMEERTFVVEVTRAPQSRPVMPLPVSAHLPETGPSSNNVDIRPLCQPLTACTMLDALSRFYVNHPLVFSPVGLKLDQSTSRDYAALRIYLRRTS